MIDRRFAALFAASLAAFLLTSVSTAQAPAGPTTIERGQLLFELHCSGCHGPEARGDGPFAKNLRSQPPDLTHLARQNDGRFPRQRVYRVIDGRDEVPIHGAREMPVWGLSLVEPGLDCNREEDVARSIWDLVSFLETLQVR